MSVLSIYIIFRILTIDKISNARKLMAISWDQFNCSIYKISHHIYVVQCMHMANQHAPHCNALDSIDRIFQHDHKNFPLSLPTNHHHSQLFEIPSPPIQPKTAKRMQAPREVVSSSSSMTCVSTTTQGWSTPYKTNSIASHQFSVLIQRNITK